MWELLRDSLQFLTTISHSRAALAAEILFLRKQLAYYQDHQIRPRRLRDASRLCLLFWSRLFDWQAALVVVKTSCGSSKPHALLLKGSRLDQAAADVQSQPDFTECEKFLR